MEKILQNLEEAINCDLTQVPINQYWNDGETKELKMHSIHSYPAKFPAFIAEKAISYAEERIGNVLTVCDIFCGCGTVALEAYRRGLDFWGCDINPVAALIATVKSNCYNIDKFKKYYSMITENLENINVNKNDYSTANSRLKYWYKEEQYLDLLKLKNAINELPNSKYKKAFLCIFSSILKSTSVWLTKSIKPQVDPKKIPCDVNMAFQKATNNFIKIISTEQTKSDSKIVIENCNFLKKKNLPQVDLIVTSPPYVTSYEYADLHQLSSLWLDFTDDYTKLRKGTIGSVYNSEDYYFEIMDLNETATRVVNALYENKNVSKAKVKSVARYYIDMQNATNKCFNILSDNGLACYVIGDTEYKGIRIENAKHLVESLLRSGFSKVNISKRKISNKILSPYRDENGKFSSDHSKRQIYHEEYVIMAYKKTGGQ